MDYMEKENTENGDIHERTHEHSQEIDESPLDRAHENNLSPESEETVEGSILMKSTSDSAPSRAGNSMQLPPFDLIETILGTLQDELSDEAPGESTPCPSFSSEEESEESDLVSHILGVIEDEIIAEVRGELNETLPLDIEADKVEQILEELPEIFEKEGKVIIEPSYLLPERTSLSLPLSYNEDRLVILIRDPYKAFAYWDFSIEKREALGFSNPDDETLAGQLYLKIYKGLEKSDLFRDPQLHLEIPILPGINSCYFELDEAFNAYYGTIEFVPFFDEPVKISRSNVIKPPKASLSEDYDSEWKAIEKIYQRFYNLVKKELQAETRLKEIVAEEEIREIAAIEGIEELEELKELAREQGLTTEEIATRVETFKTEKLLAKQKAAQQAEEKELLSLPLEEQRHRRQQILQRLVAAYLEKRAMPGGIYAPTLPGQHSQEKDWRQNLEKKE
jgi:hypothetical protein